MLTPATVCPVQHRLLLQLWGCSAESPPEEPPQPSILTKLARQLTQGQQHRKQTYLFATLFFRGVLFLIRIQAPKRVLPNAIVTADKSQAVTSNEEYLDFISDLLLLRQ